VSPRTTTIRQSREKRGGRREKKKCKVQKDRLETTIPLRTKQILTQSSHRQLHRKAGRSPSKVTNRSGDHRGKAESNPPLLETLFVLSKIPHSKSVQTHFQTKGKLPLMPAAVYWSLK